jgi:hypothetical protein
MIAFFQGQKFIPSSPGTVHSGSAANAVNFQVYLIDGIVRWNTSRSSGSLQRAEEPLRTLNVRVKQKV